MMMLMCEMFRISIMMYMPVREMFNKTLGVRVPLYMI